MRIIGFLLFALCGSSLDSVLWVPALIGCMVGLLLIYLSAKREEENKQ